MGGFPDSLLDTLSAQLAERVAEHDRDGSFPFENFALLHRHGLIALTVPKAYGGAEADLPTVRRAVRAVAKADPATALVLVMQYVFHLRIGRNADWPAHLRERISREAVEHGALINALSVEPELGTPQRGGLPATIGRRVADGWRVSGHKIYSTGVPALSWFMVIGRTDEAEPRLVMFLVPAKAPCVRIVETWNHLGMRATGSHDVILEDVLIPEDHFVPFQRLGERDDAVQAIWGTVLISTIYDAVAGAARDWLVGWLATRRPSNLGSPLSSLARVHEAVGAIDALLTVNRVLLDQAVAAVSGESSLAPPEVSAIKYQVTGNAIEAVERALQLTGNPGLSRGNPLERHYRDVLCSRVHTPQNDVILTGLGRRALGPVAAPLS